MVGSSAIDPALAAARANSPSRRSSSAAGRLEVRERFLEPSLARGEIREVRLDDRGGEGLTDAGEVPHRGLEGDAGGGEVVPLELDLAEGVLDMRLHRSVGRERSAGPCEMLDRAGELSDRLPEIPEVDVGAGRQRWLAEIEELPPRRLPAADRLVGDPEGIVESACVAERRRQRAKDAWTGPRRAADATLR